MDLTQATDALFTAGWEAFVETRTRLADELARAGRRDDSRALKKIRRPAATAWATNQVARRARAAVEAYLSASDELRARQTAVLGGGGDRSAYQAAAEAFRHATTALGQAVRQVLQEGGREPERAMVEGVVANVRAAALADERRAELLAGRLLVDLVAGEGGLEGLFGASLAAGAAASAPLARAPTPEVKSPPVAGATDAHPDAVAPRERAAEAQARARREEHARRLAAVKVEEAARLEAAAHASEREEQARAAREATEHRAQQLEAALADARQALDDATSAWRAATHASTEAAASAAHARKRREAIEKEPLG